MKKKMTSSEARYLIEQRLLEQQLAKEQAEREAAHTRAKQSEGKIPPTATSHHHAGESQQTCRQILHPPTPSSWEKAQAPLICKRCNHGKIWHTGPRFECMFGGCPCSGYSF